MLSNEVVLVERVLQHIAEIGTGNCSITDAGIAAERDPNVQEILAGLLMLYVIGLLLPPLLATPVAAIWKLFDVLFIGLIQAFIFMLLTLVYFGLAREVFEQEHSH